MIRLTSLIRYARVPHLPRAQSSLVKRFSAEGGHTTTLDNTKVQLPLFVINLWENERQRLQAENRRLQAEVVAIMAKSGEKAMAIMAQNEEKAIEKAVRIAELKKDVLTILNEKLRIQEAFNVRGGLERIGYQAMVEGMIPQKKGVQSQLDALAMTPAFARIYDLEVSRRQLRKLHADACRKTIYYEVSKHAHGNQGVIQIRAADFVPGELAAVVSYYKLQDNWDDHLQWEETEAVPQGVTKSWHGIW